MEQKDFLILVDENDRAWGKLEKSLVHEKGLLHRAFSIFIFNSRGEMLLQQRADSKYHSAGLWTNACCSHPRWGEELNDAVKRRLNEEMGLECQMDFAFSFQYKAVLENQLIENEVDHVYVGVSDDIPFANPQEVKSCKYLTVEDIRNDMITSPENFTYWFKLAFEKVISIHQNRLVYEE